MSKEMIAGWGWTLGNIFLTTVNLNDIIIGLSAGVQVIYTGIQIFKYFKEKKK